VHRDEGLFAQSAFFPAAAIRQDGKRATEDAEGRRRAQTDQDFGLNRPDLAFEPGKTGLNFGGIRLGVDAALSARNPFEVFHGVRHVSLFAANVGLKQRFVQKHPRRPHDRLTRFVFVVSGLFSDEQNTGALFSFAEHGLSRVSIESAAPAILHGFAKRRKRDFFRQKELGAYLFLKTHFSKRCNVRACNVSFSAIAGEVACFLLFHSSFNQPNEKEPIMKKIVLMLIASFALGGVSFAQAGTAGYHSGSGSGSNVDTTQPDANAYPTPGKTMQQKMDRPSDMNKSERSDQWKKDQNKKHHRPSSELNDNNINGSGADTNR